MVAASASVNEALHAELEHLREMGEADRTENASLRAELQESNRQATEALEQQTATGGILSLIASSPTDSMRVLDAIAESAIRLCGAGGASVFKRIGDRMIPVHQHGSQAVRVAAIDVDARARRLHHARLCSGCRANRSFRDLRHILMTTVLVQWPDRSHLETTTSTWAQLGASWPSPRD